MSILSISKRQIHETKGSFYIYLPKEWIKNNIIDESKTKSISFIDYFEGSLILKKDPDTVKVEKEVNIPLKDIQDDKNSLKNYIIAAYIIGANKITLSSDKGLINSQIREEVSEQIRDLPGFEIIAEDENIISAKEIGQILDISSIIQTLFSTTTVMFKAIQEIITKEKDPELLRRELKSIIKRDDDIDRYRHMVDRQSHVILSDPYLIAIQKISPIFTLHVSQIASHIERIADHIVELAKFFRANVTEIQQIIMQKEKDDKEKGSSKKEGTSKALKVTKGTKDSLSSKDIKNQETPKVVEASKENSYSDLPGLIATGIESFTALSGVYQSGNYLNALNEFNIIHGKEKDIQKKLKNEEFNFAIYHLGRIFSYCVNIAEILINQTAYDVLELKSEDNKTEE